MDEKSDHFLSGCNNGGLLSSRNDYENDCFNEGCNIDTERTVFEDARNISNSSKQESKEEKRTTGDNERSKTSPLQTEFGWVTSKPFISSHGSKNFLSILEQNEQVILQDSFLESKGSNEKVQLPILNTWGANRKAKLTNKTKTNANALGTVEEILPPIKGKRIPPRRKSGVTRSPLANASVSFPLLENSGLVNVINPGCDSKHGIPASESVSPNSSELTNVSDGWTTADRDEIKSIIG